MSLARITPLPSYAEAPGGDFTIGNGPQLEEHPIVAGASDVHDHHLNDSFDLASGANHQEGFSLLDLLVQ
eukprot:CAMPEP_0206631362 /NCGR_PEP_ID=MMETSP0325_2-20121206/68162_1 /ASSEMBLY_ACC=CAM_ASM_000347 /TAXON_ID=2866 /ORGANISM="Crypthecodinium cohnii, Strain Seligo" /LENGTH=69 /DNA_ID=CAMNT_0054156475 /DNA_START=535 /DNA_END=741 /DNA_ORIENTATION=+